MEGPHIVVLPRFMVGEDFGFEDTVCAEIEERQISLQDYYQIVLQGWLGSLSPYQHSFTERPSCGAGEALYALGMLQNVFIPSSLSRGPNKEYTLPAKEA